MCEANLFFACFLMYEAIASMSFKHGDVIGSLERQIDVVGAS